MNIKWLKLINYLLIIIFISGCEEVPALMFSKPSPTSEMRLNVNTCLPSLYPFSYPAGPSGKEEIIPGTDLIVTPPAPWQIETSLVDVRSMSGKSIERVDFSLLNTRLSGDDLELWISITTFDSQDVENFYFAIYHVDTEKWELLPEKMDPIIVDKQGSVWGSTSSIEIGPPDEETSLLSKFDIEKRMFTPVSELQGIPAGAMDNETGMYFYSQVLLDDKGIFWILSPLDAIYSYDPLTSTVVRHIDLPFIPQQAQLDSTESIYIFPKRPWTYQFGQPTIIYQYFFEENMIEAFEADYHLEPSPYFNYLFVDHSGRLWLDNIGYRDQDGIWYQIQRSPLFVSYSRESEYDYKYKGAKIILESSDKRLWFLHKQNGLISLDPDKGEWCWFTTYQSNIVEDADHNLWMIADGKLYKYLLQP